MKLLLIAIGALVILGGGAAGAYFYFAQPAEASAGQAAEAEAAAEKAAKDAHGEAAAPAVQFVQLDAMIFPIINEQGVSQVVSLVVAIEVSDDAQAKQVTLLAPRLKDAYIQDMYGVLSYKAATSEGGVIEAVKLKKRLNAVTEKVLGHGAFNEVLLQVVNQRRI